MPCTLLSFYTLRLQYPHSFQISLSYPVNTSHLPFDPCIRRRASKLQYIPYFSLITDPHLPYHTARPVAGKYTHSLALFSPLFGLGLACKYLTRLHRRQRIIRPLFPRFSRVLPTSRNRPVTTRSSIAFDDAPSCTSGFPTRARWFHFYLTPIISNSRRTTWTTRPSYKSMITLLQVSNSNGKCPLPCALFTTGMSQKRDIKIVTFGGQPNLPIEYKVKTLPSIIWGV